MKKLKNKFIIGVIGVIALIVLSQVYIAYSNANVDTNSYLMLVKGNGTLNEARLELDNKYVLASGDKIRVIGESSLAVIEWGDGSLTRLGGNTKISIDQNQISRDYTNINISFELIAGKTWSNVVSFIGKDSSFTQSFDGIEAGVRGTVFDVDLDNDFLRVTDHQVTLTDKQGETLTVNEGNPLQISTFSFIDIEEFISNFQDIAWAEINATFDKEYLNSLKEDLSNNVKGNASLLFLLDFISPKYRIIYNLDTVEEYLTVAELITQISDDKKADVYDAVLSKYQSMNFIEASDYEFYKRKIFYKKALVSLAPTQGDKEQLVRSTTYDVQDMIKSGETSFIPEALSLLGENKDILKDIDTSFLKHDLELIPEGLREQFKQEFETIGEIFNFDFNIPDFNDINSIGDSVKGGLDSIDDGIQNFLDENVGGLINNFSQ